MVHSHQAKANAKVNAMSLLLLLEWLCNPFKQNRFRFQLMWVILCNLLVSIQAMSHSLFTFVWCERSIRSGDNCVKLIILYCRKSTFAYRSFSVAGPRLWNNLPNHIKLATTVSDFKYKLKTFLFDKYYNNSGDWLFY